MGVNSKEKLAFMRWSAVRGCEYRSDTPHSSSVHVVKRGMVKHFVLVELLVTLPPFSNEWMQSMQCTWSRILCDQRNAHLLHQFYCWSSWHSSILSQWCLFLTTSLAYQIKRVKDADEVPMVCKYWEQFIVSQCSYYFLQSYSCFCRPATPQK